MNLDNIILLYEAIGFKNGVSFSKVVKRSYPLGTDASTIVGAVGLDGNGLSGLEYYLDSYLSGQNGRIFRDFTSTKPLVPGETSFSVEPVKGESITLTIDSNIQHAIEKQKEENEQAGKESKVYNTYSQ